MDSGAIPVAHRLRHRIRPRLCRVDRCEQPLEELQPAHRSGHRANVHAFCILPSLPRRLRGRLRGAFPSGEPHRRDHDLLAGQLRGTVRGRGAGEQVTYAGQRVREPVLKRFSSRSQHLVHGLVRRPLAERPVVGLRGRLHLAGFDEDVAAVRLGRQLPRLDDVVHGRSRASPLARGLADDRATGVADVRLGRQLPRFDDEVGGHPAGEQHLLPVLAAGRQVQRRVHVDAALRAGPVDAVQVAVLVAEPVREVLGERRIAGDGHERVRGAAVDVVVDVELARGVREGVRGREQAVTPHHLGGSAVEPVEVLGGDPVQGFRRIRLVRRRFRPSTADFGVGRGRRGVHGGLARRAEALGRQ